MTDLEKIQKELERIVKYDNDHLATSENVRQYRNGIRRGLEIAIDIIKNGS